MRAVKIVVLRDVMIGSLSDVYLHFRRLPCSSLLCISISCSVTILFIHCVALCFRKQLLSGYREINPLADDFFINTDQMTVHFMLLRNCKI